MKYNGHFNLVLGKEFILPALFLYSIFISVLSFAQNSTSQNLKFKHLTIDDGLSQNAVFSIIQDKMGFMWFGTKDGLNRYDGYNFVVYQHNPFDSTTVADNFISTLFEDSRGYIWIGTLDAGVSIYDRISDQFMRIKLQATDTLLRNRYEIMAISEDEEGNIWVGTRGDGLHKISLVHDDINNLKITNFIHRSNLEQSIGSNTINDIFIDGHLLWLATPEGVVEFDTRKEFFTFHAILSSHPDAPSGVSKNGVSLIYESRDKQLWLGTLSGLVRFDRSTKNYEVFRHHYEVFRFGWGSVNIMAEDENGHFWIGTPGELMRFDPVKKVYESFRNDPFDPQSISYNGISSIYFDKSGILWVGTTGQGINIYDPKARRFNILQKVDEQGSRISGFSIRSVTEDDSGNVWIGTDVLHFWQKDTNKLISFEKSSDSLNAFGNTIVWAMIQSKDKYLWTATTEGLFRYDIHTGTSRHYRHDPANKQSLPQREVFALLENHKGQLLVMTENYLCRLMDREKGIFDCIRYQPKPSYQQQVRPVIFEDFKQRIWLGTKDGLLLLNADNETFTHYQNDPKRLTSLSNNLIKTICADPLEPQRFLWIGTNGGINRFDIETGLFEYYTEADGLPNNVVYGILPDNDNNLWLSTNKGISRFNPQNKTFRNFDVRDGLQSNEFNTGAFFRSKKGQLYFGGIKGLNYFYPESIKDNPNEPKIVLTRIKLGDKAIDHKNKPDVFTKSVIYTDEIILSHNEDIITFEFAALDYSAPEKNQYAYFLENFNQDWIYSGKVQAATYTNLPPGDYIFRVKGSNNDGVWNEKGIAIKLTILPPWWATWWAYVIYSLLFVSVLMAIRHSELRRLRLKNQLEVKKVETESLKKMDHLKSDFFANISHEFRTPLTLILGQIENVMISGIEAKEKIKLQVAKRNARRLLTLINQLLDLSKLEAGNMELEVSKHNIVSFLKSLFYSFEFLAVSKRLHLNFHSKYPNIQLNFDADKMEKIFFNLISNAIKFSDEGGKIVVDIKLTEDRYLEISVTDNGQGIPHDQLPHIFDRFYQVDSSITRKHEGTGIGLALTKELVELHKGQITVTSKEGEGTTFLIRLPQNDYSTETINTDKTFEKVEVLVPFFDESDINATEEVNAESSFSLNESKDIVLIVEDNTDIRNYIREQIEEDYFVMEAGDGESGLRLARERIPDLIITDLMMPKFDGFQLCKEIRIDEKTSHIPIIMLTAKASFEDKMEGLETGVDDYITKPFSAKELRLRVKNLIIQRKKLRKRFATSTIIKPDDVSAISIDQVFLDKVISIIENHFEDQSFSADTLAEKLNMSISQLNRKLKALIDQPAGQLMRSLRLQRAADLLKKKAGSVSEICYRLCFSDQAYFSRAFKKQFGSSPSEYMNMKG
jgi:signal transduction histidine kinase/ligand-binding sensor domain-containing protein/DNA-binding response OmpR family regulator